MIFAESALGTAGTVVSVAVVVLPVVLVPLDAPVPVVVVLVPVEVEAVVADGLLLTPGAAFTFVALALPAGAVALGAPPFGALTLGAPPFGALPDFPCAEAVVPIATMAKAAANSLN